MHVYFVSSACYLPCHARQLNRLDRKVVALIHFTRYQQQTTTIWTINGEEDILIEEEGMLIEEGEAEGEEEEAFIATIIITTITDRPSGSTLASYPTQRISQTNSIRSISTALNVSRC